MFTIITLLAMPLLAGTPAPPKASAPVDSAAMTLVVVENDRRVPVTVYLEHGDEDIRLGVVGALGDTTLRIPDYLAGDDVRFFVQPKGQLEEASGALDVARGAHVGLVIPPR